MMLQNECNNMREIDIQECDDDFVDIELSKHISIRELASELRGLENISDFSDIVEGVYTSE